MREGRPISFWVTMLCSLASIARTLPGDGSGTVLENFESGQVQFTSYPDEDQDPSGWSLDSLLTHGGSLYSLRMSGNTWKVRPVGPILLDSGDTWEASAFIVQTGEAQGVGIMDSAHSLLFAFAGTEELDPTLWVTVDQGAFPLSTWITYRLPVASEWLTRYGYLPSITGIVFINDRDADPTSVVYFDDIIDVTADLPTPPSVTITHTAGPVYSNLVGRKSVDIQFTSHVTDPDGAPHTFLWQFGDDSTATDPNPSHTFLVQDDHTYTVLLEVTDATGLRGHASCDIIVDPGPSSFPLTVNFVGDIMMARGYEAPGGIIPTQGVQAIFAPTVPFLGGAATLTVANLECTLTRSGSPHPTKPIIFRGSPANVSGLTYAGIDVVTLANNHILDYGLEGLQETQSVLRTAGVAFSGAGARAAEADRPLFVLKSGMSLAFLASSDRTGQYNNYQPFLNAGENKPGFSNLTSFALTQQIDAVRTSADLVIMEMHSGAEYSTVPAPAGRATAGNGNVEDEDYSPAARLPLDEDRAVRRQAIDAGADLVVCHHPHIIQGFEVYAGRLIAHSLGNFAFDLSYAETFPSAILNAKADDRGFYEYSVTPVYLDDDIPRRASGELGAYILDHLAMLSRELGTYLVVDRSAGTGAVVLDSSSLFPRTFVSTRIVPLRSTGTMRISAPIRLPRNGSISSVSQVTPSGAWSFRVGRELIWMGNCEDEGASLWSLDLSDELFDTTQRHAGFRSLRQRRSAGAGTLSTELENRLMVPAGATEVSVCGWLRTQDGAGATIRAKFYTSRTGGTEIGTAELGTEVGGTTEWAWYSGDTPVPAGSTFIDLLMQSSAPPAGTGFAWFDDASVVSWGEWMPVGTADLLPTPNDYYWVQVRSPAPESSATVTFTETAYADLHEPAHIFVPVAEGWNLVSNPVLRSDSTGTVRSLFPHSSFEHAFGFSPRIGYVQSTVLKNGEGYWAKFPSPETQEISGGVLLSDTVTVSQGWVMIGSLSDPVDTSCITSVPPGLRASLVYGYGSGYSPVARLEPGGAYWMKVGDSGSVVLAAPAAAERPIPAAGSATPDGWSTVTICDAAGASQTLLYGVPEQDVPADFFEMPPPPPDGLFDARFTSGTIAAIPTAGEQAWFPIALRSARAPVTVSWRNNTPAIEAFLLVGPTRTFLGTEGSLVVPQPGIPIVLTVAIDSLVPMAFALGQNYPNPFNPATTIVYSFPPQAAGHRGGERSAVTLEVFDILGRRVATLVDGPQEPGRHTVVFDATGLASGVYLYRLTAGPHTATRKLLLVR